MSEERKLQFHGGIGMSLIPVAIYVFFCMVLFIGFKAFNMEALAVGGFLALLIGGIFCTSYSEFWESAKRQGNLTLFCPATPQALVFTPEAAVLTLADGQRLSARLLVGADGRDSWVRETAGLPAR